MLIERKCTVAKCKLHPKKKLQTRLLKSFKIASVASLLDRRLSLCVKKRWYFWAWWENLRLRKNKRMTHFLQPLKLVAKGKKSKKTTWTTLKRPNKNLKTKSKRLKVETLKIAYYSREENGYFSTELISQEKSLMVLTNTMKKTTSKKTRVMTKTEKSQRERRKRRRPKKRRVRAKKVRKEETMMAVVRNSWKLDLVKSYRNSMNFTVSIMKIGQIVMKETTKSRIMIVLWLALKLFHK